MVRRRQRERNESLKEEKEEHKGQVLNEDRESEREKERVNCVRKIVSARLQLCGRVGDLVVQHINKVSDFSIFLLCTSNP